MSRSFGEEAELRRTLYFGTIPPHSSSGSWLLSIENFIATGPFSKDRDGKEMVMSQRSLSGLPANLICLHSAYQVPEIEKSGYRAKPVTA